MRQKIIIGIGILLISIGSLFLLNKSVYKPIFLLETSELGFPLTLVSDKESSEFYQWGGQVLISVGDYSRDNLEKIFAWYSKRHPKGTIILSVYTNEKDLNRTVPIMIPGDPSSINNIPSTNPSNASYIRDERDGSEYYGYDLDPVKKDKQANVFLKLKPYKK